MTQPSPSNEITFASLAETTLPPQRARRLAAAATEPVSFSIGRTAVEMRFSDRASASDFVARYGDLPAVAAASGAVPAVRVFVVGREHETLFWSQPERVWRWPGGRIDPILAGFFADAVLHREFMRTTPHAGFHAAVLALGDACAAVTGVTTAGKTTTAVACVRAGLRLYSDERCIVQEGKVVPFLRRLTLRSGGRAVLLGDEPSDDPFAQRLASWARYDEVGIRPSQLFGIGSQGGPPLPLRWLFLIDGYGDRPELTPTTPLAAAPAIVRSLSSGESALDRIAGLLRELRGVDVYRLRLGRPAASAQAIKEVMQRAGSSARV